MLFIFNFQFSQEQFNSFEVCDEIDECLQRLEFDDNLAVATSRLHVQILPLYSNIFCFDQSQNVFGYYNSFMIRTDFKGKSSFNHIIKSAVVSGLISKIEKDIRFYSKMSTKFIDVEGINGKDFSMTCIFFLPFIVFAIFVAFIEFIIHYKLHSAPDQYLWKFLDKLIDGKRRFFLLKENHGNASI